MMPENRRSGIIFKGAGSVKWFPLPGKAVQINLGEKKRGKEGIKLEWHGGCGEKGVISEQIDREETDCVRG